MARVIIDVSAVGEKWFKEAISQLATAPNVTFVYSDHEKYKKEAASNEFLGRFLQLMRQKKRTEDTDPVVCENLIAQLEALDAWKNEEACDDPHIFAMAYQKPNAFLFTSDKRIASCKACMVAHLNKRYRSFSTIQSQANYDAHEHQIRA